ncbi:hypothetical protein ACFVGN_27290 [Streptomyces sp. NPDC057757]|uniref:hypothetical protein n=1 Tax=Streptomyces sp. NPDC057757 TaxID=3346241 RepID=UPI00368864B0
MRYVTAALCWLYAAAAAVMLHCAAVSHANGSPGWTATFGALALLLGCGTAHHAYHRDELRFALLRLERALRPPTTPASDEDGVVAVALAAACCDTWWTSAGERHDPQQCTRKDQTT